jgi:hypothetical protein
VVIYLRAATGLWPVPQIRAAVAFPESLLRIERCREAATIIMLVAIAALAERKMKERIVAFLWAFAFWDIFYYVWLRFMIGWPNSLTTADVLFLIPGPWVAQVWFPISSAASQPLPSGSRISAEFFLDLQRGKHSDRPSAA